MECQRCLTGKEAKYRVYTDLIDMKVCEACADEARRLGIAVEVLDREKKKQRNGLRQLLFPLEHAAGKLHRFTHSCHQKAQRMLGDVHSSQ